jgi:hypothetical protein
LDRPSSALENGVHHDVIAGCMLVEGDLQLTITPALAYATGAVTATVDANARGQFAGGLEAAAAQAPAAAAGTVAVLTQVPSAGSINQSINVTSVAMKFIGNSCQPFTENHLFG